MVRAYTLRQDVHAGRTIQIFLRLKDGVELEPNENVAIESLPDGTQRLTIRSAEFLDDGFYRCVATNVSIDVVPKNCVRAKCFFQEYGTASTKAELIIDGKTERLIYLWHTCVAHIYARRESGCHSADILHTPMFRLLDTTGRSA